jgi:Heterokaryon incompatibility protein (HET)
VRKAKDISEPSRNDIVVPDLSLNFEFQVVSLDDKPVYTAFSYVWGEPSGITPIRVDGRDFLVTKNLGVALQHLQLKDIAPAIWIDSICINQKDESEKSAQVRLMGSIYSKARRVMIWLGPSTASSDFILDVINGYADICRSHYGAPGQPIRYLLGRISSDSDSQINSILERAIRNCQSSDSTTLTNSAFVGTFFELFCSLEWWSRVWIVQEFVLSKSACFQIGCRQVGEYEFRAFSSSTLMKGPETGLPEGHDWIIGLPEIRYKFLVSTYSEKHINLGRTYQLLAILYCRSPFRHSGRHLVKASDPRDQIFGLVGLVQNDFHSLGLTIDYKKSWEAVYTELAEKLLQNGQLDLLALCQPSDSENFNLPSWVPIWHLPIYIPSAWFTSDKAGDRVITGNSNFSAGSSKPPAISFSGELKNMCVSRKMQIKGLVVDEVFQVQIATLRSMTKDFTGLEQLWIGIFKDIKSFCKKSKELGYRVYTSESLEEAEWRIPVWDHQVKEEKKFGLERATNVTFSRYLTLFPLFEAYERLKNMRSTNAVSEVENIAQLTKWHRNPEMLKYMTCVTGGLPARPFITKKGYIGLAPTTIQEDDVVVVCYGSHVPWILRRRDGMADGFIFVGEAFVYGIMDGELLNSDHETVMFDIY